MLALDAPYLADWAKLSRIARTLPSPVPGQHQQLLQLIGMARTVLRSWVLQPDLLRTAPIDCA